MSLSREQKIWLQWAPYAFSRSTTGFPLRPSLTTAFDPPDSRLAGVCSENGEIPDFGDGNDDDDDDEDDDLPSVSKIMAESRRVQSRMPL